MSFAKIDHKINISDISNGNAIRAVCASVNFAGITSDKKTEERVMQLIEKIASAIYTECLDRDKVSIEDIRQKVAKIVVDMAKSQHILPNEFDFESAVNLQKIQNTSASLKKLGKSKITPKEIVIDKELANQFLDSYKHQLIKAQDIRQSLQSRIAAGPAKKLLSSLQATLLEIDNKIENYEKSISAIETANAADKVKLNFPPMENLRDYSEQQIDLLFSLDIDSFQDLRQQILLKKKLEQEVLERIRNLKVSNFTTPNLSSIIMAEDNEMVEKVIFELTQNLIKKLDEKPMSLPLDNNNEELVNAFLNLDLYLSLFIKGYAGDKTHPLFAEAIRLIQARDPEKYKKLLDDSEKNERRLLLENRASATSAMSKHINNNEEQLLLLFEKIVTEDNHASSLELNRLAALLEISIGNKNLNQHLSEFSKEKDSIYPEKYKKTIGDLKMFSYKTKFTHLNDDLLNKCERALKAIAEGKTITKEGQLSIFEFGRLDDLAKLKPMLDKFHQLGLTAKSPKLAELYKQAQRAAVLMDNIQQEIARENTFKNGDMLLVSFQKQNLFKNELSASRERALTQKFVSKYGHASQFYLNENGQLYQSHVGTQYSAGQVKPSDLVTGEFFRIDILKLISPENQKKLEAYYSKRNLDYKVEVEKIFHQSIYRLHTQSQERFAVIHNDEARRFQAGLADLHLYGGHHRDTDADRKKIHGAMYGVDGSTVKNKMVCSEFVVKSTVSALFETNEILTKQLNSEGISCETDVVTIPLKRERLKRVHPERLVKVFDEVGCLTKVEPPRILSALVDSQNLSKPSSNPTKNKAEHGFFSSLMHKKEVDANQAPQNTDTKPPQR